jgi:hypothetical protein
LLPSPTTTTTTRYFIAWFNVVVLVVLNIVTAFLLNFFGVQEQYVMRDGAARSLASDSTDSRLTP